MPISFQMPIVYESSDKKQRIEFAPQSDDTLYVQVYMLDVEQKAYIKQAHFFLSPEGIMNMRAALEKYEPPVRF